MKYIQFFFDNGTKSDPVGVTEDLNSSDIRISNFKFGYNRCLVGINGDFDSVNKYLTSWQFSYADSIGDGYGNSMFVTPRLSENTPLVRNGCGESVYYDKDPDMLLNGTAAQFWTDQGLYFDFDNPDVYGITKDFTQMVWKGSTKVGLGVAGNWLVARWCDAGNDPEKFAENVFKPPFGYTGP